ncbi:tRNA dihydrouridine synthase [Patescibacteria group bacterium]
MPNIYQTLKKPIICLAPMDGVTDSAFRQLFLKTGKPDLMFTEFTNVQSIFSHDQISYDQRLSFTKPEKPLIAQIWGLIPELYEQAAKLLVKLGFDGIDINLGCPDKNVIKKGACSALINNKPLVKQIIQATQAGANGQIPVSAKIRIGFDKIDTENWASFLLKLNLDALIVHGRTTKQLSKTPNNWQEIAKVVKLRDQLSPNTIIIGNGDVLDLQTALKLVKQHNLDGIMIGRGALKDPYVFSKNKTIKDKSKQEKIDLLLTHLNLFDKTWGNQKPFHVLKRFFKIYISGFKGALALRIKLMETKTKQQAIKLLK